MLNIRLILESRITAVTSWLPSQAWRPLALVDLWVVWARRPCPPATQRTRKQPARS
jgi:hypothetical protein